MTTNRLDTVLDGLEGFTLFPNFITPEEEDILIGNIEDGSRVLRRRSKRLKKTLNRYPENWEKLKQKFYGYSGDTRMKTGCFDTKRPIPVYLNDIIDRIKRTVKDINYNSVVINDYPPGVGIIHHYDLNAYVEAVVCLSLGSDVELSFVSHFYGGEETRLIPRRSVYIIEGDALEKWRHGIHEGQKTDRRYAITFRKCDLANLDKNDINESLPLCHLINF